MNDLSNISKLMKSTPVEIARDMWATRFQMPVGMFRSVDHGFSVTLFRKTKTEFVFMFSGMNRRDLSIVQDAIREDWDEPSETVDDDDTP